ncbi:MAG: hypothetical protein KC441_04880 [Anaerolineales bacterium]|nr:hypothetical protein [Anaerolineales bacterium]
MPWARRVYNALCLECMEVQAILNTATTGMLRAMPCAITGGGVPSARKPQPVNKKSVIKSNLFVSLFVFLIFVVRIDRS